MYYTPAVGRTVLVLVDPTTNNGADVAPAVLTRVWAEIPGGRWTVNYRLLPDGEDTPWITSATLYVDEQAARTALPVEGSRGYVAFWPPRGELEAAADDLSGAAAVPLDRAAAIARKLEAAADGLSGAEAVPLLREAAAIWVTLARS
ncbi:hypothetical protein MXD61_06820 [Frankia sp. AgPm24]|uniref:hypothetical protein n=1 Tax=Frankia sp. AgPm24 TaxID=631128 RepID=UPI00200F4D6B|nr:hypothetical protein [Frankia sp. AgPm24]MCK9921603.1 hypothetical protein [Frankia sp. AgPm24]